MPGAWTSTANQLERRAFILKDTLFVIDNYAPSGLDAREVETKAARLLRAQGNLAGRARLRPDLTERPAFPPRGLILATGEQHPPGRASWPSPGRPIRYARNYASDHPSKAPNRPPPANYRKKNPRQVRDLPRGFYLPA